jgi:hypothetical protein
MLYAGNKIQFNHSSGRRPGFDQDTEPEEIDIAQVAATDWSCNDEPSEEAHPGRGTEPSDEGILLNLRTASVECVASIYPVGCGQRLNAERALNSKGLFNQILQEFFILVLPCPQVLHSICPLYYRQPGLDNFL